MLFRSETRSPERVVTSRTSLPFFNSHPRTERSSGKGCGRVKETRSPERVVTSRTSLPFFNSHPITLLSLISPPTSILNLHSRYFSSPPSRIHFPSLSYHTSPFSLVSHLFPPPPLPLPSTQAYVCQSVHLTSEEGAIEGA